jgi:hypothetical protein
MNFFETVENLLNTYNSIDVRVVAFLHDNVWKAAYLIVRFRIETEIELKKEQHDLLTKIGVIDEKDFCVKLFAFPIDKWAQIKDQWQKNFLCLESTFAVNFDITNDLNVEIINPSNYYYDHTFIGWNSYNTDVRSIKDIDVNQKVKNYNKNAQLQYSKNIMSYLSMALAVEDQKFENNTGFTLMLAPIFFKLNKTTLDKNIIHLEGEGFVNQNITIIIDFFKNRNGSYPFVFKDRKQIQYVITGDSKINSFKIMDSIPSLSLDDGFKVSVYGKNGILLHESFTSTVGNNWNTKSILTNPIYPIFKQFVNFEELKSMLFLSTSRTGKNHSDYFEKGVSWLLSMLGLNAVWLGKDFESTGSNEERIVIDLLGHNDSNHIFLVNVTSGIPTSSDFARERRYRENLQNKINNPDLILSSILFSNGPTTNLIETAKLEGLMLVGKNEIESLLNLIEKGDNDIAREYLTREKITF